MTIYLFALQEEQQITLASVNDLTLFKKVWSTKENRFFFGNKIYQKKELSLILKMKKIL